MSLLTFIHASAHHMPQLADGSVQMIATSPPYYGLRRYLGAQDVDWPAVDYAPMPGLRMEWVYDENEGEWVQDTVPTVGEFKIHVPAMRCPLGNEPTLEAYIAHLVLCLREWRRVLRDDGVCFVNLGDSFSGSGGAGGDYNAGGLREGQPKFKAGKSNGLKPKDLMMVPARFALAAQADGWFLRSDMIGAKVAPMPESVTDRPTRSHEHIFMLTKRGTYFCDMEGVREPLATISNVRNKSEEKHNGAVLSPIGKGEREWNNPAGRNCRDVIEWRPQGFSAAHFATWPEAIPERLIRMGTSERGACPHCGAAWRRVVERESNPRRTEGRFPSDWRANVNGPHAQGSGSGSGALTPTVLTVGWLPTCDCRTIRPCPMTHVGTDTCIACNGMGEVLAAYDPVPCVVLDPFSGSGTTAKVAARLGRRGVGVDISQEYLTDITAARMGDGFQMEMIR